MNLKSILLSASALMMLSCICPAQDFIDDDSSARQQDKLPVFDRLDVNGIYDVTYVHGEPGIILEGGAKAIDNTRYYVDDEGELNITPVKNYRFRTNLKITVSSFNLSEVEVSGACSFKTNEILKGDEVSVKISGAGNYEGNGAEGREVEFKISGASNVRDRGTIIASKSEQKLSGAGNLSINELKTGHHEVRMSGAGVCSIGSIKADYVDMHMSGAGKIDVNIDNVGTIDAKVSGVGKVVLTGNRPKSINSSVSGVGKVDVSLLRN